MIELAIGMVLVAVAQIAYAEIQTNIYAWPPACWTNAAVVNPNEDTEYQAVSAQARSLVLAGKFDEADDLARKLRTSKAILKNGDWKLRAYYNGFRRPEDGSSESQWKALLAGVKNWSTKRTNSVTSRIALAVTLTGHAWHARGDGWANTVSEDSANKMEERLEAAFTALKEAKNLPEKCPHWYAAAQKLALGLGWDRAACDSLLKEATSFEPKYYAFYEFHAYYLLPRWYGNPGDWEAFARQATIADPTIYPRILWYIYASGAGDTFKDPKAMSWSLAKKGFEAWIAQCPDSFETKSIFCMFCGFANDCERMKSLFRQIGDNVDLAVWTTTENFLKKRRWLDKWCK